MIRGLVLIFCFIPINDLALGTMYKKAIQYVSGLYNLIRNLGRAIGLAIISSQIIAKTKIYTQSMKRNLLFTLPRVIEQIEFFNYILAG